MDPVQMSYKEIHFLIQCGSVNVSFDTKLTVADL
jgi:hypothetical protein